MQAAQCHHSAPVQQGPKQKGADAKAAEQRQHHQRKLSFVMSPDILAVAQHLTVPAEGQHRYPARLIKHVDASQ